MSAGTSSQIEGTGSIDGPDEHAEPSDAMTTCTGDLHLGIGPGEVSPPNDTDPWLVVSTVFAG